MSMSNDVHVVKSTNLYVCYMIKKKI